MTRSIAEPPTELETLAALSRRRTGLTASFSHGAAHVPGATDAWFRMEVVPAGSGLWTVMMIEISANWPTVIPAAAVQVRVVPTGSAQVKAASGLELTKSAWAGRMSV